MIFSATYTHTEKASPLYLGASGVTTKTTATTMLRSGSVEVAVCESKDTHVPQAPATGFANHGVRVFFLENLEFKIENLECSPTAHLPRAEGAKEILNSKFYILDFNLKKLSAAKARSSFEGAAAVCESKDTHVTQASVSGRANHGVRVFFSRSFGHREHRETESTESYNCSSEAAKKISVLSVPLCSLCLKSNRRESFK